MISGSWERESEIGLNRGVCHTLTQGVRVGIYTFMSAVMTDNCKEIGAYISQQVLYNAYYCQLKC